MVTPADRGWMHLFQVGIQYYVAGRAAAIAELIPLAGNLLHHSVEMLLKGELSKTLPLEELKTQYGHLLIRTWIAFKSAHAGEDLSLFDQLITDLDRFEKIRYPDDYIKHGALISVGWGTVKPRVKQVTGPKVPEYFLSIDDIDELIARLFIVCSINPVAYLGVLHSEAEKFLRYQNAQCAKWLPAESTTKQP